MEPSANLEAPEISNRRAAELIKQASLARPDDYQVLIDVALGCRALGQDDESRE